MAPCSTWSWDGECPTLRWWSGLRMQRAEDALGNSGALRKASKYVTRGRGDAGLAAWFRQ